LFAGSFDPFHWGHAEIVRKALLTYDEVIVGVGVNPSKNYMFTLEERVDMIEKTLHRFLDRVTVVPFSGLTIHFAFEQDIPVIVKGIRNTRDMEYEQGIMDAESTQNLNIKTEFIWTQGDLAKISSSTIKGLLKEQGYIDGLVHPYVKRRLEERMHKQYIIGITGVIGAGKTTVGNKFVEYGKEFNMPIHNIELDYIPHKIYDGTYPEPRYAKIRKEVVERFGNGVENPDGSINRKSLGDIVFNDMDALEELNNILNEGIRVKICKELYGKKGLIMINSALLAESGLLRLANLNIVLVNIDKETQKERLKNRGLNDEQIHRRMRSQYGYDMKWNIIESDIQHCNTGRIFNIDGTKDDLRNEFGEILTEIGVLEEFGSQ
jgi:pantetheine-phosphate adenylyltransferase